MAKSRINNNVSPLSWRLLSYHVSRCLGRKEIGLLKGSSQQHQKRRKGLHPSGIGNVQTVLPRNPRFSYQVSTFVSLWSANCAGQRYDTQGTRFGPNQDLASFLCLFCSASAGQIPGSIESRLDFGCTWSLPNISVPTSRHALLPFTNLIDLVGS